ncbi:MAG: hypothetical protein A2X96_12545 [Syntrophobacterales bacterium GWC2_56_13]|nr:MAG: hypothetical protein A2X96_12545 [Syntrophobacterales bacterium GWC2_56_13]
MKIFQSVLQHRSILFQKYITPNQDSKIGANCQNQRIIRSMMKLAEGNTIADFGSTFWVGIRYNMCCIKKFWMT